MVTTKDVIGIYEQLGQVIKIRREAVGLVQQNLADAAGVSRAQIANIERGNCGLTIHTLVGIASALRCSAWELLRDAENCF